MWMASNEILGFSVKIKAQDPSYEPFTAVKVLKTNRTPLNRLKLTVKS